MTTIPPPNLSSVESAREALWQALAALDRVLDPMAPPASEAAWRAAVAVATERVEAARGMLMARDE